MPVAVVPSRFEPEQVETPAQREQRTVHDVYEQIAPHFSATRYKVRLSVSSLFPIDRSFADSGAIAMARDISLPFRGAARIAGP